MSDEARHRPIAREFPTRRFVDDRPRADVSTEPYQPSHVRERALGMIMRGVCQYRLREFES